MKANVYIDGFNLYYGRLKGTAYKWLDPQKLCELALPRHTINRIRYFTARVSARDGDLDAPRRQETYLKALQTIPKLSIHYGHFLVSKTFMPRYPSPQFGQRTVQVTKTEEK
ncbi:MAG: NYN domain-containing protein, partial [Chloroflexota bacterium]